ncbi:MAG: hypothetical protein QM572_06155 [Nocardioides sp.]|uniref:hypothetical protein n=1 Tax=Nocardioides sp. TaxID=35761 RepID=UPI0039E3DD15
MTEIIGTGYGRTRTMTETANPHRDEGDHDVPLSHGSDGRLRREIAVAEENLAQSNSAEERVILYARLAALREEQARSPESEAGARPGDAEDATELALPRSRHR